MSGPNRIKVFISYNHVDRKWVKKLASVLRSEFDIFLDEWSIRPGTLWLEELETALKESNASIIVWSRESVKKISRPVLTELTALLRKYWNQDQPLIPVLYGGCQLEEIPEILKAFQYVDFHRKSPRKNRRATETLRKALRGHSPGTSVLTHKPPISLRAVFLLMMIFIGVLIGAKALYTHIHFRNTYHYLRAIQQKVQNLESQINSGQSYYTWAIFEGEKKYSDPITKQHVLTDVWGDGKLTWRNFYQDNRLIARDVFRYTNGFVTEKIRYYMDTKQRIFLIDHFTQDGLLTKKRHCRDGPERPCDVHIDDMRSPLPPPQIMFYR